MKLLIASDVHGSALCCRKLIDAYKIEGADRMLLLGDILYHGPRNNLPEGYDPKGVLEILNPLKNDILCVRGNCDTEVDQMVLEFPILAEYTVLCIDNVTIFATHGHIFNKDRLPPLHRGDILLNGHTHIPAVEKFEDYLYINPGSVSIPKNNSERSYILFEDGLLMWKTLDGKMYQKFKLYNR